MKKILVTGGLGYIGSHTCVDLLEKNYEIIIVDNLCNSELDTLNSIYSITKKKPKFFNCDITNYEELFHLFKTNNIDCVIHFAALKSVSDSVQNPKKYFFNNVEGIKILLRCCKKFKVNKFIFSSSCTVYGIPKILPVNESLPFGEASSPYGETKIKSEEILLKFCKENKLFKNISLRYFNPIGAHNSNLIGESPKGTPSNLVPIITKSCFNKNIKLKVFGNDYNTKDGTAIRDYIHIEDLSKAHIKAYEYIKDSKNNYEFFNVGTGIGYSVIEVINTFEEISGKKLNYIFAKRRKGDIEKIYADIKKVNKKMKWKAKFDLKKMLESAWSWELKRNSNKKTLK